MDPDEIVDAVTAIASGFGGINLEDISAPRCFQIEQRLRGRLDIPVFHDDQHGTAVVALAAFLNALRVVGKRIEDVRIVITGVGAAGVSVIRILQVAGARDIVGCDSEGVVYRGRPGLSKVKTRYAEETNPENVRGTADDALSGAEVFTACHARGAVTTRKVVAGFASRGEAEAFRDGQMVRDAPIRGHLSIRSMLADHRQASGGVGCASTERRRRAVWSAAPPDQDRRA